MRKRKILIHFFGVIAVTRFTFKFIIKAFFQNLSNTIFSRKISVKVRPNTKVENLSLRLTDFTHLALDDDDDAQGVLDL